MVAPRPSRAHAVVGANYGDEGKGLVTDFLAASSSGRVLVVRANGGAQAGHTVTLPDGRRHVFHHLGSGTLAGADTFLGRHFAVHPMLFRGEIEAVYDMVRADVTGGSTGHGVVMIDGRAAVTTPYDMMLNQFAEEARGGARHGSCGLGFGETVERHQHDHVRLTAAMLESMGDEALRGLLDRIRKDWVPQRAAALGFALTQDQTDLVANDAILDRYVEDCRFLIAKSLILAPRQAVAMVDEVIFEGAQGLLLDQGGRDFPHVTRSHTGLVNVVEIAMEAGITALDVTYVTRCYLTRHGAGPLAHEIAGKPWPTVVDATNIPNAWQGSLRFAWLDVDRMAVEIARDLARARSLQPTIEIAHGLAVTCLDQASGPVTVVHQGRSFAERVQDLPAHLADATGAAWVLVSDGPSRADVRYTAGRFMTEECAVPA